jgi:hypothetical protein
MSNIQLLATPYSAPIYISPTNMVMPLTIISANNIYNILNKVFNIAMYVLEIFIKTSLFILSEASKEIFKIDWNSYFTLENMICVIGIFNLFMLIVIDNQKRKMDHQKIQIESLEKYVNYLKKVDVIRNDDQHNLIEKINKNYDEVNKKIILIDKKFKKIEKDIKIYE